MRLNCTILIVAALCALALPAVAQDTPAASPTLQAESPACPDSTPTLGVEVPPVLPTIGGGGSCSGIESCYCFCRYYHRCDQDPAECDPLAQCLNDCDAQYPSCPYPGGTYPESIIECL